MIAIREYTAMAFFKRELGPVERFESALIDKRAARQKLAGRLSIAETALGEVRAAAERLAVAGAPIRQIGIDAVETFVRLAPGGHLITLKDMADGCVLAGGNPQLDEVLPGRIVQVRLDVLCGSATPS